MIIIKIKILSVVSKDKSSQILQPVCVLEHHVTLHVASSAH